VLELAALRDDKLFYFYDDLKCLDEEPHGYRTAYEDDVRVTEEIYCRLTFHNCRIRSVSAPFLSPYVIGYAYRPPARVVG